MIRAIGVVCRACLAALLCAAVIVWVRSYIHADHVFRTGGSGPAIALSISRGRVLFATSTDPRAAGINVRMTGARWVTSIPVDFDPSESLPEYWPITPEFGSNTVVRLRTRITNWRLGGFACQTAYVQSVRPMVSEAGVHTSVPLSPQTRYAYLMTVPIWPVVIVIGSSLVVWIGRLRRRRRWYGNACCVYCGYDLRATPGRCPEWGEPAAAAASPAPPPAPSTGPEP
jgi:hypothetical protein